MADYHGSMDSQTPAPHRMGVMGEERDPDHVTRQGNPGQPPAPSSPSFFFAGTPTARSSSPTHTNPNIFTAPTHPRRPASSSGLVQNSSSTSAQQRRSTEHQGARGEFVFPQDPQRLDCPDGGDLRSRVPDFRQGFRYGCVPGSDLRKEGVLLPPRSSQRSSALPLRSPKRTISFDFPENMDPRTMEQIRRQIVQMAQEAGASDSVKIFEAPPEHEEPPPIFQLQDPPKPKFKRQLSADNSPPDKSSPATAVPDSASGRQHAQSGTVASSMAPRASASLQSCALSLPAHADGSSYTSSAMSPKRLKSEHGALSCTPPKSPLVKQLVTQVAETTLNRRGGRVESKHADVVHVLLGGDVNDRDKSAGRQTRDSDSVPDSRQADEPDSRLKRAESKTSSACDVVSVLNSQQPKKSATKEKTVPPFVSDSTAPRRPEEHMQTLHMLFKVTGDNPDSKRQRQSSSKNTSDFDQDSVRESNSLVQKQSVDSGSENRSQKTDRVEMQTAGKEGVPLQNQTTVSTSSQPRPVPSTAVKTTTKSEDMLVDNDSYMAGLEGRLKDMQRQILAHHPAYTGQATAQTKDEVEESTGTDNSNRESTKETVTSQRTSASSSSTTTTLAATSRGLSSEEQSRTARLCGSKTNPFTFSSTDIEKAKTVQSTHDSLRHTPSPPPHNRERTEDVSGRASSEEAHGAGQFRLGELWISKSRENPTSTVVAHRQLSDPGTLHHPTSKLNPVLEKVKATPLRQFSEPARPQDNLGNNEPNEFQKKCQEPERSLQQHAAFRSKNCDCFAVSEGRPSFFLREGEERADDTKYGSCSASQDQFILQPFSQCGGQGDLKASRRRQIFDNSLPSETTVSREYKDPFWPVYKQTYSRHHPGEQTATSSHWIPSPRHQGHRKDRASASSRQALEDDSVFEEGSGTDRGSPFKNPPVMPSLFDRFLERSADRMSSGRLSSERSPKRPALRSQSNVEQSPNKAELEAMAHYKYLRSFSEHLSDPKRLMEQLQALRPEQLQALGPADNDQLMEQLYDLLGGTGLSCSSFSSEKDSDRSPSSCIGRGTGVRRTLFQDANAEMPSGGQYELAEWQQQGCYTYPPPLARRQTCSPARDLRRCLSWIRDMERSGHVGDMTRPRQPGDLDVTLECTQATPARHKYYDTSRTPPTPPQHPHSHHPQPHPYPYHPDALCKKVEAYIQQILQRQLQTRPSDSSSQAEMNAWIAQTNDIERLTQEASQMISSLSEHHRTVYDVLTGSVVIKVNCSTLTGVHDLWEKFESGLLQRTVDALVGGERFRALAGTTDVEVKVTLCPFQYALCLEELESSMAAQTPVHSPVSLESERTASSLGKAEKKLHDSRRPVSPLSSTPNDVTLLETLELMMSPALLSPSPSRSPSTPSKRHGKFAFGDCSARKAFSELNLSDGELTPTSPSKKFFDPLQKENSMLSPLVSPRIVPSPTGRGRLSLSDVMDENYELLTDQT